MSWLQRREVSIWQSGGEPQFCQGISHMLALVFAISLCKLVWEAPVGSPPILSHSLLSPGGTHWLLCCSPPQLCALFSNVCTGQEASLGSMDNLLLPFQSLLLSFVAVPSLPNSWPSMATSCSSTLPPLVRPFTALTTYQASDQLTPWQLLDQTLQYVCLCHSGHTPAIHSHTGHRRWLAHWISG